MSCTTASPGSPSNWTSFAPSWKTPCHVQMPDSGPIKGPPPHPHLLNKSWWCHNLDCNISLSALLFANLFISNILNEYFSFIFLQFDHLVVCMRLLRGVWFTQASGRRQPGDGSLGEAAHRGPAEDQEEVEWWEQHQTGDTILQVRPRAGCMNIHGNSPNGLWQGNKEISTRVNISHCQRWTSSYLPLVGWISADDNVWLINGCKLIL